MLDGASHHIVGTPGMPSGSGSDGRPELPELSFGPVDDPREIDGLGTHRLSETFDPFLAHFARVSRRAGGEVLAARYGPAIVGVLLTDGTERVGSIFAPDPAVAGRLRQFRRGISVFCEHALPGGREPFEIFEGPTPLSGGPASFRHHVRMAAPEDRAGIHRLLEQVYGPVNPAWAVPDPDGPDRLIVCEGPEGIVGAGGVTVIGPRGRLHSLTVAPRFRGLGIGRALWTARALYAARHGVRSLLTEIASANAPSKALATRGGMRPVGLTYLHERA